MREILFRGQRKTDGKWIEGSLLKVEHGGEEYCLIFGSEFQLVDGEMTSMSHALVLPETVGQFTGAADRQGRNIFEGDIVRFWSDAGGTADYEVLWFHEGSRWGARLIGTVSDYIFTLGDYFLGRCEVDGNTYDGIPAQ